MGSSVRDLQASTSSVILKNRVNTTDDARDERARTTFDVSSMSQFLNGGLENMQKRQKFAKELEQLPWAKKDDRFFLTREQEYVNALRAATQIWSKMRAKEVTVEEALLLRLMVDFPGGLELHIGMFIPTILGQGTEEQQKELLPKCNSLEIIGTYAQTELGHGTFLRGLETTATFVQNSDQFIIHSPTPTATKWWPGGLGKTATHAVVMARLFVAGKDYGPHAFIVQLRDLKTHKALPGIVVGDIGPKFGYNGVDNGFLRFDHVMVPRCAMLSRFSQVTREGKYVPPPPDNQKAMYSTMLFVRADIVRHSARYLARASTISVRYCCVRRQTAPSLKEREVQVIDYDNTATTLLPLVAASYVLHAAGTAIWAAYERYESEKNQGRFGTLPELHASSSGLKAVCTEIAADGIEACRRACGGHGYSVLSGLPTLYASYVQNVTWEGDNNVLLLQTGRFLLKIAGAVAIQQPGVEIPASLLYLTNEVAGAVTVRETGWIKKVLTALARNSVRSALTDIMKHPDSGGKVVFDGPAWNKCTVSTIAAARAHIFCVMLESYEALLKSASGASAANMVVLQQIGELWAVDVIIKNMGGVLESGVLKTTDAHKVRSLRRQLQQTLRPNAISLVDSWAFTDYELHSALGKQDGDVYTALFDMAQGSPLNKTDEGPAWEAVMKPVIQTLQHAKL